ncbi:hypothetical protein ACP4OV_005786 [Aristida adscensionis]
MGRGRPRWAPFWISLLELGLPGGDGGHDNRGRRDLGDRHFLVLPAGLDDAESRQFQDAGGLPPSSALAVSARGKLSGVRDQI